VKRRQTLTVAYLTILVLIAVIGLTPQGRAFAQTIFKFFRTTEQSSFPLSEEEINEYYAPVPTHALTLKAVTPVPPSPDDCSLPEEIYACKIQKLENEMHMDLKEFATPPSGWAFSNVELYQGLSPAYAATVVVISYRSPSGYLFLSQGEGEFPPDQEVLSSAVQPVKIGESYGEYVDGFFGVRNGDTNLTWDSVGADQRIRWKEGGRWFELLALAGPGTSGYVDKDGLVSLAADMVYQPIASAQTPAISLDTIPNIPMAMEVCDCEILQPTKLPEHMSLDHIRYDPQWKSITLNYGYRALRIVQTPVETAILKDLAGYKDVETVRIGEEEGQYGVSPAQKTIWESATPPAFSTTNTYSVLLWEKDGIVYQVYFDQSFSAGGQLTKQQLTEIGESLQ
jgi:hypothetical protein